MIDVCSLFNFVAFLLRSAMGMDMVFVPHHPPAFNTSKCFVPCCNFIILSSDPALDG